MSDNILMNKLILAICTLMFACPVFAETIEAELRFTRSGVRLSLSNGEEFRVSSSAQVPETYGNILELEKSVLMRLSSTRDVDPWNVSSKLLDSRNREYSIEEFDFYKARLYKDNKIKFRFSVET